MQDAKANSSAAISPNHRSQNQARSCHTRLGEAKMKIAVKLETQHICNILILSDIIRTKYIKIPKPRTPELNNVFSLLQVVMGEGGAERKLDLESADAYWRTWIA